MRNIHIFLAGDSTMSNYEASVAPRMGWGQVLGSFQGEQVHIYNEAASGRSSKSFIDEGRLTQIEASIGVGDYLLIQFGHNDEKEDAERHTEPFGSYQAYLQQYIDVARAKKQAYPILITPVQRRKFAMDGRIEDTHAPYPAAMKQLAQEQEVPVIDLNSSSKLLLEQMGPDASKALFLWFEPGEQPNYPDGAQDDTHFSTHGATEIAKLVVQELQPVMDK